MSRTSSAVKNRYNAKTYDIFNIVVPKGEKERIKEAAIKAGQSVNAYVLEALRARMTAEGHITSEPPTAEP